MDTRDSVNRLSTDQQQVHHLEVLVAELCSRSGETSQPYSSFPEGCLVEWKRTGK
ncbi:hypothetical protein RvY_10342 [Ramazzottius varieornatus]|uniref:Uncharacterized protein n=1 Tax=Ramazzottius varieornatus TaxID=947166 RepID=A0A1D1VLG0_RAMVA|nr:hypothetical protein RvY_10342 [Ramazzottius varieornatus]